MLDEQGRKAADESGDPHWRFLEPLEPRLRLLAAARLPVDRVEDFVRDTMAEVAQALESGGLQPGPDLPAEVYGMACRRMARGSIRETFDPSTLQIEGGECLVVARCLEKLEAADRDILYQAFVEGRSPSEIAARKGWTLEEVRRRKVHAVERFQDLYRSSSEP